MRHAAGMLRKRVEDLALVCYDLSRVIREPVYGLPTRSGTNQAVQSQKMARGLKFRI